jgi:cell division protease FtsH
MKETKPNQSRKTWLIITTILLVVLLIYIAFADTGRPGVAITDSAFEQMIEDREVEQVYYYNGVFRIRIKDSEISEQEFPSKADYHFVIDTGVAYEYFYNKIKEAGISYDGDPTQESIISSILPYLSLVIIIGISYFIFRAILKGNQGTLTFGKSKARASENIKIRFSDVAGADEEKAELQEVVEFLKNPQKFTDLGARIPKGVLLVGPPGTGKTLLAKAVAGESNVPFLSISGSDFVEMFVGVGASRVRDLFDQAKKSRPCIIFIDEIDAVGRQRGTGLGGGNDEREQTLNQLLVEMDGFEPNEGIIVLAATNRSDVLDPALLRPGRFDRQIYVHIPDVRGREAILKIHARNKSLDNDIDFQTLARITSGFTGADIENMLNEAAILAARADRPKIIMSDITEGINKVIMGPQKKSRLVTERDKKITTYHEAGHAILAKLLPNCDEVQEVSIIPRGMAAGYTMSRPSDDDNHMTFNKLNDIIAMTMGGRIAEEIIFKDISTGAQNDIKHATELARKMVAEWGMSKELGFVGYDTSAEPFLGRDSQNQSKYSEKTAATIDEEIRKILNYNYERAFKILKENKKLMDEMSNLLIVKETIYKEEVDMIMKGEAVDKIIAEMDKKAKERKEKEEKVKADNILSKRMRELETKLKTAEMLLKAGVITNQEFEQLKLSKEQVENDLKNATITENKVSEIKQEEQENVVKKRTTKKVQKDLEETGKEEPKPVKTTKKTSSLPKEKKEDKKEISTKKKALAKTDTKKPARKRAVKSEDKKDDN